MIKLLLLGSCVILTCILCNRLTSRIGVPMLFAFILLGMLFGSEGILHIPFDNFAFAENMCTIALIFIMFYGGFGTRWKAAKPVAGKALLLSSVGTVLTAVLTGLFCHFALGFGLLEGLLVGAVLGSTDAASVFSVLRSKKLSLKNNTDSLLEVESGSNDPFAYMLTIIILTMMQGNAEGMAFDILGRVFAQVLFGAVIGIVLALLTGFMLERIDFGVSGFDTAFVLAAALLSYALPSAIGGNGYLSANLMGIILENRNVSHKKVLVNFFDGLTSLMQMFIFFMLGLLSFPSKILAVCVPGLLIAVFLTFVARPLAVALILTPLRAKPQQQLLTAWAGLRGAASIVFAIMATRSGAVLSHDLFHIVFCVVLVSILFQGSLLPFCAKKLHMIDESRDILTTFTDYSDETDVHFIDIPVSEGHPWIGLTVKDLNLPPGTLLVFLNHPGEKSTVPNGDTVLREGDVLVLGATAYAGKDDIHLTQIHVDDTHTWRDKRLCEIRLPKNSLIILVRRGGQTIIPNGDTKVLSGDELVCNTVH